VEDSKAISTNNSFTFPETENTKLALVSTAMESTAAMKPAGTLPSRESQLEKSSVLGRHPDAVLSQVE
jgi:hypothetical protein